MKQAVGLDPLSPVINSGFAWVLYMARQYEAAITQSQRTLGLDSNYIAPHWNLMEVYEQKALYSEALTELERSAMLLGWKPKPVVSGQMLQEPASAAHWTKLLMLADYLGQATPVGGAVAYARAGNKDKALEYLEKAFEVREPRLNMLSVEPGLDSLRLEPRFQNLLRRIHFSDQ
jgi:tetratricopeptide (TPR) repeat protein